MTTELERLTKLIDFFSRTKQKTWTPLQIIRKTTELITDTPVQEEVTVADNTDKR